MIKPIRLRTILLPAIATLALLLALRVLIARAAADDAGGAVAALLDAGVTSSPPVDQPAVVAPTVRPPLLVVRAPLDLDTLTAIGATAGPLAILLQPLVGMLAAIGFVRRRLPWLSAPRALAIVAVVIADLVVLGPAIAGGTITLLGAVFAVAVHAGQIRYPDAMHRSDPPGGAGGALAGTALVLILAIGGCARVTAPPAAGSCQAPTPGVLDRAADVGRGVLCSSPTPPAFLPWSDSSAFQAGWAALRALVCSSPPAPAAAAGVAVGGAP